MTYKKRALALAKKMGMCVEVVGWERAWDFHVGKGDVADFSAHAVSDNSKDAWRYAYIFLLGLERLKEKK